MACNAVAQKQRKVVNFARLAGLQNQGGPGAGGGANQVMMQAGNSQQCRNGGKLFS